jgi:hypothetical protein
MLVQKHIEINVFPTGDFLEEMVKSAGFVDVQVRYIKIYAGTWKNGPIFSPIPH